MNKDKLLRGRFSLVTILILESLVLGIGCISWALIHIGAQSVYSVDSYSSPSSIASTFPMKQAGYEGGAVSAPTEPVTPSDTPDSQKILYPIYPLEGDHIGILSIPAIDQKLSVFQGTETEELNKGVGHFIQSVLPGEEDNCVLSGHRDSVFAELGDLKIGDQLIVHTSAGKFTYQISTIRIVDKDDKTVIVPADHAILTVTTCYPFIYIGSAPDRYILTADLV